MQKQLIGQNRQQRGQALSDRLDMTPMDIKWRRGGGDRRCSASDGQDSDYAEKRSCGDRRHDFMTLVSRIIFPKGWAKQ